MDQKQKERYLKKITFNKDWLRDELGRSMAGVSEKSQETLLRSLYQNGHKVVGIRDGYSRSAGRKRMLFVEVVNLNGQYMTYRIDYLDQGQSVDVISAINGGWHPATIWK